jgi:hypothetical protein
VRLTKRKPVPELLELSRDETARDEAVCHRALLFHVVTKPDGHPRTAPLDAPVLVELLRTLESRDNGFRQWASRRLPVDARVLEAVASHLVWLERSASEANLFERRVVQSWLAELASANPELVGRRSGDGRLQTDEPWDSLTSWAAFWATNPTIVSWTPREPDAATARELVAWIAKNRRKLPEQVA